MSEFQKLKPVYFRNTLKEHRDELGISPSTLAWQCSISRQGLFKIENGTVIPSVLTAIKLAHYLRVEVEDLFQSDWQYFDD